jgi:ABC-2 type transport system ATP-binding protein
MIALRTSGLSKSYGSQTVLDALNLEIVKGEVFALLGPNGSGKSTFFRILSTLLTPDAGSAEVGGFDVVRQSSAVRGMLGVVFQSPSLDRKLTVRENLLYGGALYGLHGTDLSGRVSSALAALRLEEKSDAVVETLSGGQQRRTEIAKCLLTKPEILLLDEPSTGLDPAARMDFWGAIAQLRIEFAMTVVFTTHLMDESAKADRVGILNAGRLLTCAPPAELLAAAGPDVVRVVTDQAETVAGFLRDEFRLNPHVADGEIRVSAPDGHAVASRLQAVLSDAITATTVARPTLEDVFLFQTGCRLNE